MEDKETISIFDLGQLVEDAIQYPLPLFENIRHLPTVLKWYPFENITGFDKQLLRKNNLTESHKMYKAISNPDGYESPECEICQILADYVSKCIELRLFPLTANCTHIEASVRAKCYLIAEYAIDEVTAYIPSEEVTVLDMKRILTFLEALVYGNHVDKIYFGEISLIMDEVFQTDGDWDGTLNNGKFAGRFYKEFSPEEWERIDRLDNYLHSPTVIFDTYNKKDESLGFPWS